MNNPYASKTTTTQETKVIEKNIQKQIGLQLSDSCKTMLRNNITTNCPSYGMVKIVFPDNTDPKVSGDMVLKNGIVEREFPKMKNSYRYYPQITNQTILWLDPPLDVQHHLDALIIIEPSLGIYKTHESYTMSDYTIQFGQGRWVDDSCQTSRITAHEWIFLTGDTLNYLLNNCNSDFTRFDHTLTQTQQKSYQDFSSSYNYKLYTWINEIKEKCLTSYGCDIKPPER